MLVRSTLTASCGSSSSVALATSSSSAVAGLLRPTCVLLKKAGKPLESPDYKQTYLPYEKAPSEREVEQARNQMKTCGDFRVGYSKKIPVLDLPKNPYTYGKEGSTVPISIFKDQDDPVIGPEWTYPGIYELKVALKHKTTQELFEMNDSDTFESPWQKQALCDRLDEKEDLMRTHNFCSGR